MLREGVGDLAVEHLRSFNQLAGSIFAPDQLRQPRFRSGNRRPGIASNFTRPAWPAAQARRDIHVVAKELR
jgi:hypothetical protein